MRFLFHLAISALEIVSPFAAAMAAKTISEKTWSCTVLEPCRLGVVEERTLWPQLPRWQTAGFVYFCMEFVYFGMVSVASLLVGVVGQNF